MSLEIIKIFIILIKLRKIDKNEAKQMYILTFEMTAGLCSFWQMFLKLLTVNKRRI